MKIEIYRAADAFLYLPSYVAQEYKILDTLFLRIKNKYPSINIDFMELNKNEVGDTGAFNEMYKSNSSKKDTIAVSICSPVILLSNEVNSKHSKDCMVIAAMINRLPFWGINHCKNEFLTLEELSEHFDSVVYLNDNFKEGNYLGKKIKKLNNINRGFPVDFGNEIDVLETNYSIHKPIAISADIVKIAKTINRKENPLNINYRFSKDEIYLTTGIITTKNNIEKYPEILTLLIEGIQKAISMIYSSEYIAIEISKKIGEKIYPDNPPNLIEINTIVNLINTEKFYPADLNISKESWTKALKNIASIELWDSDKNNETFMDETFGNFVYNKLVLESEKQIATQYGIDLTTFDEEINREIKEPLIRNVSLIEKEILELRNKIEGSFPLFLWLSKKISSVFRLLNNTVIKIVGLIVSVISISIYLLKFVTDKITMKDIYTSLIIGFYASTISSVFIIIIQYIQKKEPDDKIK
jgi:hypothetical protein